MTRYIVMVPNPADGTPWEIHRADTEAEAQYVAVILGSMGCPLVAIVEQEIDVDATFNALVSTLEGCPMDEIAARLEYLRGEIRAERISMSEIVELQSLAEHIDPGDVELLEWAGVPEFPNE